MSVSSSHRVFVAGATGYTGRAVVETLRSMNIPVWAHVRANSARAEALIPEFEGRGAQVVRTDWNTEALKAELQNVQPTVVFALLGITRSGAQREAKRTGKLPDYETVDYGMTRMLLDATRAVAPTARFVYLSSTGISASRPSNAYMLARWKCEQDILSSGIDYLIARPSFISGPDRDESRPMERIGSSVVGALGGALSAVGITAVERAIGPISNHQLARVLVDAALDPTQTKRILEAKEMPRR